jgi:ADP-heptose:LPS heptosyltransferase
MTIASSKTILIIQTAFIGDTILASHFARALKEKFPDSKIHFLIRKGNESVILGLPTIERTWIWDKKGGKFKNLIKLIIELRQFKFDMVFNLHRHFNSGLFTAFMKSPFKAGFIQNPLSFFYTFKVNHQIPDPRGYHEVQRNLELIPDFKIENHSKIYKPELPIQLKNIEKVSSYLVDNYFVIAPASIWFTKALSEKKFHELTGELIKLGKVYFIGADSDKDLCERIRGNFPNTENLCGKLNLLDSAALMKNARRVFVNDSAPLHLASSMNARTTAIFCSTIPAFGYSPLADDSKVVDVGSSLGCRPCGLHGHKSCPMGHFKCSEDIEIHKILETIT